MNDKIDEMAALLPGDLFDSEDDATHGEFARRSTRFQAEIDIDYDQLISHHGSDDPRWSQMADMSMVALDLECENRPSHFPKAVMEALPDNPDFNGDRIISASFVTSSLRTKLRRKLLHVVHIDKREGKHYNVRKQRAKNKNRRTKDTRKAKKLKVAYETDKREQKSVDRTRKQNDADRAAAASEEKEKEASSDEYSSGDEDDDIECPRMDDDGEPRVSKPLDQQARIAAFGECVTDPNDRRYDATLDNDPNELYIKPGPDGIPIDLVVCESEEDLLRIITDLMVNKQPSIMTYYNGNKFDVPYMLDRAKQNKLDGFPMMSPYNEERLKVESTVYQTAQSGRQDRSDVYLPGVICYDLLRWAIGELKLSSYSLNSVAEDQLKKQKADVHHTQITPMFNGTKHDRETLLYYNMIDSDLCIDLIFAKQIVLRNAEIARVTGTTLEILITKGQGIKTFSQLLRLMLTSGFLVPDMSRQRVKGIDGEDGAEDEKYEGATVFKSKVGYYEKPISTLDFASLYPSIMIERGLSFDSFVPAHVIQDLLAKGQISEDDYNSYAMPDGRVHYFIKERVRNGLLSSLVGRLVSERNKVKGLIKIATDKGESTDILEARSLALKLAANSTYGFAAGFVVYMPEVAETVCFVGRRCLSQSIKTVEAHFTRANGYKHDAKIVAGDTDSIFILWGVDTIEEAHALAIEAEELCNRNFRRPIRLEFEKQLYPAILFGPKMYCFGHYDVGFYPGSELKNKKTKCVETMMCYSHQLEEKLEKASAVPSCKNIIYFGKVKDQSMLDTLKVRYPQIDIKQHKAKLSYKGIETRRRDKILFIKEIVSSVVNQIMLEKKPIREILQYVHDMNESLCKGELPLSKIIQSVSYKGNYDGVNRQTVIAQMIAAEDAELAPEAGDRVNFIYIKAEAGDKAKSHERVALPWDVFSNDLPIDYKAIGESLVINAEKRVLRWMIDDDPTKYTDLTNSDLAAECKRRGCSEKLLELLLADRTVLGQTTDPRERDELIKNERKLLRRYVVADDQLQWVMRPFYTTYSDRTKPGAKGGILQFVAKRPTCMCSDCHVTLPDPSRILDTDPLIKAAKLVLCKRHVKEYERIKLENMEKLKTLEEKSAAIWDFCYKCSPTADTCANDTCGKEYYWMRRETDKRIIDTRTLMERFTF